MEAVNEVKKPRKGLAVLLPVLIILTAVAFVFAFSASTDTQKYKKLFEKEMAFRLDMEEKVSQLRNEKIELTAAIDSKDLEIKGKDKKIQELNDIIETKDTEIKNLNSTMDKINSLTSQAEQTKSPVSTQPQ
ncbi:MAG: hypothetical protein PHY46_00245 [Candidatus Omnitrophica bacterium]|nr:hypothetical protein [Candidatus Omnitrophota bacterium]MDD5356006.1 hypothetical protein [Candidatus Omnitrophota bacterium]